MSDSNVYVAATNATALRCGVEMEVAMPRDVFKWFLRRLRRRG